MAGKNQNLKAVITFGGNIDSTWGQSTNGLNKNIKSVTKESENLKKKQVELKKSMKDAKLAGKDISSLKKDYEGVTREIKKASSAQETLNRDIKKTQGLASWKGIGKGIFSKALTSSIHMGRLALGGWGVMGGANLIEGLNRKTMENADKAGSYGVGIDTYNAWASLASQTGLGSGDNIGNLFNNYLKSAGRFKSGNKSPQLEKAFGALGFGGGSMAGLTDLQQFDKIISRALSLKDSAQANFAVSSLLGPDAAKILNTARAMGKSWEDIIAEQKRYNLVTQQGAAGAARNAFAIDRLKEVFSSSAQEVAGQLGNSLAPRIEEASAKFADWLRDGGIDQIIYVAKEKWLPGLLSFASGVGQVAKVIYAVAQKLSWLLPDTEEEKKRKIIYNLASGNESLPMAEFRAKNEGLGDWFNEKIKPAGVQQQLVAAYRAEENKVGFFERRYDDFKERTSKELLYSIDPGAGKDPLSQALNIDVGNILSKPKSESDINQALPTLEAMMISLADSLVSSKPSITDQSNKTINVNVYAAPGQDERQVADETINKLESSNIFTGNNSMYDKPRL